MSSDFTARENSIIRFNNFLFGSLALLATLVAVALTNL